MSTIGTHNKREIGVDRAHRWTERRRLPVHNPGARGDVHTKS
jgi:hypothetical protein